MAKRLESEEMKAWRRRQHRQRAAKAWRRRRGGENGAKTGGAQHKRKQLAKIIIGESRENIGNGSG